MTAYKIVNFRTKEEVKPTNLVFTGDNEPWEVLVDSKKIKSQINANYFKKAPPYVSKYLPFLPIDDYANFVSLQEGSSPLMQSSAIGKSIGVDLLYKLEFQNPTGSFKDRGSAVELSVAKEMGVKGIVLASTGNMAASCSCYAAAAQIPCFVFVPEDTPQSKLAQAISYGGQIVQVKGTYGDAAKLAEELAKKLDFYLAGDYAFRVEGQKTAAFELVDQLFYQAPDVVIVPIGCGTNLTAYMKGFREYKELGFIDKIPKIVGVQAHGARAVVESFNKKSSTIEPFSPVETIASAIGIGAPLDGEKALEAIYASEGLAISVTDREMLEAQYRMSTEEGIFVETSCASSVAAAIKLKESGFLDSKKVVCVLTGSGLKDPSTILKIAIRPPTIYPKVEEFLSLYERSFFSGKNVSFVDRNAIVFEKTPTKEEITKKSVEYFDAKYSDDHISSILRLSEKFLKKGKTISFSDFQDIIQEALENIKNPGKNVLEVVDFTVNTAKDKKPEATVIVKINGKEERAEGSGVGPVDAVISALRTACSGQIEFSLANYQVAIRSHGTNAVVFVEMKLTNAGKTSVGTGTSPDIIQASIEAFEEAYNGLF